MTVVLPHLLDGKPLTSDARSRLQGLCATIHGADPTRSQALVLDHAQRALKACCVVRGGSWDVSPTIRLGGGRGRLLRLSRAFQADNT